MSTEYCIKLNVTCEDDERLDNLACLIMWILESPNPETDQHGLEGVTFEGMIVEELNEDGDVAEVFNESDFGKGYMP